METTNNQDQTTTSEISTPNLETIPETPQSKDTFQTKPKYNKRKIILLTILFISLLLGALFSFLNPRNIQKQLQNQAQITPTPSPPQNPTTNWKTYINEEHQFSISYPQDWKLGESVSKGYPHIRLVDPIAQQITLPQTELDRGAIIEIYLTDTSKYAVQPVTLSSLKETFLGIDLTKGLYDDPDVTQEVQEKTIGNLKGIKETVNSKYYHSETFAFIKEDQNIVFIIILKAFKPLDNKILKDYISVHNLILSTFNFLDQTSQSDTLKTYLNSTHNYQIVYPSNTLGITSDTTDVLVLEKISKNNFEDRYSIGITIRDNSNKLSLRDWIELNISNNTNLLDEPLGMGGFISQSEADRINSRLSRTGLLKVTYEEKTTLLGNEFAIDQITSGEGGQERYVIVGRGNKIYILSLAQDFRITESSKELFDQILSTFQFIDPALQDKSTI